MSAESIAYTTLFSTINSIPKKWCACLLLGQNKLKVHSVLESIVTLQTQPVTCLPRCQLPRPTHQQVQPL